MSCPHFYPANLLSKCLLLLLHLPLSRLPREPRERLISPCMDKSDGDRAALTQAEAFDQKATHTFPRKAVCLKPARRVYAVYRLPSGENSRWSGAAGFVWNGQFDLLWWRVPDMRQKKAVSQELSPHFIRVSDKPQIFLFSHEDVPSLFCGKPKSNHLLENNNLCLKKPSYIRETAVFTDASMQWHDSAFPQPQKSSAEIFLVPLSIGQS